MESANVSLESLAASLKAATAQSGTNAMFEDSKRKPSSATTAQVATPVPTVTGDDLLMPCRIFFNVLANMIDADAPNATQVEAFSNALAPVLNKYAPATVQFAPEIALAGATAGIGYTMWRSHQTRTKAKAEAQESLPLETE